MLGEAGERLWGEGVTGEGFWGGQRWEDEILGSGRERDCGALGWGLLGLWGEASGLEMGAVGVCSRG